MRCKNCGQNIKSDYKYCPFCAARLVQEFQEQFNETTPTLTLPDFEDKRDGAADYYPDEPIGEIVPADGYWDDNGDADGDDSQGYYVYRPGRGMSRTVPEEMPAQRQSRWQSAQEAFERDVRQLQSEFEKQPPQAHDTAPEPASYDERGNRRTPGFDAGEPQPYEPRPTRYSPPPEPEPAPYNPLREPEPARYSPPPELEKAPEFLRGEGVQVLSDFPISAPAPFIGSDIDVVPFLVFDGDIKSAETARTESDSPPFEPAAQSRQGAGETTFESTTQSYQSAGETTFEPAAQSRPGAGETAFEPAAQSYQNAGEARVEPATQSQPKADAAAYEPVMQSYQHAGETEFEPAAQSYHDVGGTEFDSDLQSRRNGDGAEFVPPQDAYSSAYRPPIIGGEPEWEQNDVEPAATAWSMDSVDDTLDSDDDFIIPMQFNNDFDGAMQPEKPPQEKSAPSAGALVVGIGFKLSLMLLIMAFAGLASFVVYRFVTMPDLAGSFSFSALINGVSQSEPDAFGGESDESGSSASERDSGRSLADVSLGDIIVAPPTTSLPS